MAQKVTVALEDDLTGGPAEQTVRFAFDGTDYEIDLNAKNAAAFGKQLAPYLEHARKAGRAQLRRPGRTTAGRQRSGDIRAWAKEHGLSVERARAYPGQRAGAVPRRGQRALTQATTAQARAALPFRRPDGKLSCPVSAMARPARWRTPA